MWVRLSVSLTSTELGTQKESGCGGKPAREGQNTHPSYFRQFLSVFSFFIYLLLFIIKIVWVTLVFKMI